MIRMSITGWDGYRDDVRDGVRDLDGELRATMNRAAFNIKTDWRRGWSRHRRIRHLADAINYDITGGGGDIEAEIGPDKTRMQGALGNIIEFGSRNNAPIPAGNRAARAEEPRLERAVAEAGEKAVGGR